MNGTSDYTQLVGASLNTYSPDTNGVSIGSNYTQMEGCSHRVSVDKTQGMTMSANPKIDSYVAPSNDVELAPKKLVAKKTLTTTAGKGPTEGLNVVDNG